MIASLNEREQVKNSTLGQRACQDHVTGACGSPDSQALRLGGTVTFSCDPISRSRNALTCIEHSLKTSIQNVPDAIESDLRQHLDRHRDARLIGRQRTQ
jgi:hypothetical protein